MNKIDQKLNELIDILKDQEEVKHFKQIEHKMLQNELVKSRIEEYKKMQQKVVLYESRNDDLPKEVSERLNHLYEELFNIPIYNEFINLQSDINEVLQNITLILENELNN